MMNKKLIILITLLAIVISLIVTNPSELAHKKVIEQHIFNMNAATNAKNKYLINTAAQNEASFEAKMMNNIINRENYIGFSLASIKGSDVYNEGSKNIITIGIFGQIYLLKQYDMISKSFVYKSIFNSTRPSVLDSASNVFDGHQIIGKPFIIEHLEIAQFDFPQQLNWEDAKKACHNLGAGWRLPTKVELNILFQNKKKIGGFDGKYYWSSSEINGNFAWGQSCDLGIQYNAVKDDTPFVRAVRSF